MLYKLITHISDAAYRHTSPMRLAGLFVLIAVFNLILFPYHLSQISPPEGATILDLRFGYSPNEASQTLDSFGTQGRQAYLLMLAITDSIYPLVYALFLVLAASYVLKQTLKEGSILRLFNLAAIDVALFDYVENLGIIYLLSQFPAQATGVARMASFAGIIKWLALTISLTVIIFGLVGWVVQRRRDRRKLVT